MNHNELHVIFGTGQLGMAVMHELVHKGKKVRMVNTRGQADVPAGVEVVIGDAYSPDSVQAHTAGAQVVYQCAQPGITKWPQKFPALQASILEGTVRSGAVLVIGENLYMYGEVSGPIHEGLPYAAATRKGRTRAQMAEAALAAHHAGILPVVIGRGSDFFGPGVLNSAVGGERFIQPALQGKTAQLIGRLDIPHTVTYIEDFGRALVLLGEHEQAYGQAWHVPNDQPHITQRQLMTMFFEESGHKPHIKRMGWLMQAIGRLFIPEAREGMEMAYEFEQPFVVDSSKFERAFGMQATPLREAVRRTVAWYQEHTDRKWVDQSIPQPQAAAD